MWDFGQRNSKLFSPFVKGRVYAISQIESSFDCSFKSCSEPMGHWSFPRSCHSFIVDYLEFRMPMDFEAQGLGV